MISNAYAQADAVTVASQSGASSWIMIGLMLLIMWLFIIRPQAKRHREHQNLIGGLKKGDKVVTDSGIYGEITKVVDEGILEIQIAEGVKVQLVRNAVAAVLNAKDEKPAKAEAPKKASKAAKEKSKK